MVSWHFLFSEALVATLTDLPSQLCLAEGQQGGQRLPGTGAKFSTGSFSTGDPQTLKGVVPFPSIGWT